jgi:hypothetical protein
MCATMLCTIQAEKHTGDAIYDYKMVAVDHLKIHIRLGFQILIGRIINVEEVKSISSKRFFRKTAGMINRHYIQIR